MNRKRLVLIFAAAAVMLLSAACSGGGSSGGEESSETQSAEGSAEENSLAGISVLGSDLAGDTVIARPTNGAEGMDVTLDSFLKEYRYYLAGYGITDDVNSIYADMFTQRREYIVNYLINERISDVKAKELGLALTGEELSQAERDTADSIEQVKQSIRSQYIASGVTDEGELDSLTEEFFGNMLEKCGLTTDDFVNWQRVTMLQEKLTEYANRDFSLDYSEAQAQMQSAVDSAKAAYEADPGTFDSSGYANIWLPEGSRIVKHILLKLPDGDVQSITALRREGKDDEADELRSEKTAALGEMAELVRGRIESGEDFDGLMKTYSDDTDTSASYTVTPGTKRYMQGFAECALEIPELGGVGECVTDYGIHFIKYVDDAAVTEEQLKATTDEVYQYLDEAWRSRNYSDMMTEWRDEYNYEIERDVLFLDGQTETSE